MVKSKVQENGEQQGEPFTYSSTLECTDCGKVVQVETAGHKNLEAHHTLKACCLASLKHANGLRNKAEKLNQVIDLFFKPWASLNPSTVSAPPPIHLGTSLTLAPECHMEPSQEFMTQAMVFQGQSTASQAAQLPVQPVDKPQDMKAERGLQGTLSETKIEVVVREIEDRLQTTHAHEGSYPSKASTSTQTAAIMEAPTRIQNTTKNQDLDVIDIDKIEDIVREVELRAEHKGKQKVGACRVAHKIHEPAKRWPCEGILVAFPEGTTHHQSYPLACTAKLCQKMSFTEGRACENCRKLTSSTLFSGIMDRIQYGTHENIPHLSDAVGVRSCSELFGVSLNSSKQLQTPTAITDAFMYHGIGALIVIIEQLRMSKLNDSRKLLMKVGALEDHKQWILAIHQVGIKTLIQQYERAAEKLYKPKGYTNEDIMRSIVLL
ncbi:hypothetical protein EDB84DRAFT_1434118 [Lactarius hengduanensis]|nr:hypothetical protein EDB84DRAFT_1434118 [Lactarius hengduanensis]